MAEAKLTKKQQKAAQFKAAKKGKTDNDAEVQPAPVAPVASSDENGKGEEPSGFIMKGAESPVKAEESKPEKRNKKRKRLAAEAEAAASASAKDEVEQAEPSSSAQPEASSKKTKKTKAVSTSDSASSPAKKTTYGENGEVETEQAAATETATTTDAKEETTKSGGSNKFILFVGNMSFKTTSDTISKHFSQTCGETPSVRLLTKKVDPAALAKLSASKKKSIAKGKAADPTSAVQSKGCAFVEFKTSSALRKALGFHHTMLEGRKINVELTAGGGGKSEQRQEKIKKKNDELEKERQKLHGKYVAPQNEARKSRTEAGAEAGGESAAANGGKADGRPNKRAKKNDDLSQQEEGQAQWSRNGKRGGAERRLPKFMATGSNAVRVAPTS